MVWYMNYISIKLLSKKSTLPDPDQQPLEGRSSALLQNYLLKKKKSDRAYSFCGHKYTSTLTFLADLYWDYFFSGLLPVFARSIDGQLKPRGSLDV